MPAHLPRRWSGLGVVVALLAEAMPVAARAGGAFDGAWQTTVSCAAAGGALGFSYRFDSEIKDGAFRGLHGELDAPGYLLITGAVGADGSAKLYAAGRTGSKEFVPGRDTPRGTEYGYNIDAHFADATGTGTRVEGRPCSLQFERR